MSTTTKLSKDASKKDVEQKLYRSMIRSLLYLIAIHEIFVSQSKYAGELMKKFGLEYSKHSRTPMSTTTKLSKDESRKNVEQNLYRSMIRSLLYLTTCRPDISLVYSNVDYIVQNIKTHLVLKLSILFLGAVVRNSYG
ncbi:hypothetical protein AAG906_017762 [Vitis piasezkii]